MAPLLLEGDTLGQRHRQYNKLVEAALADKETELAPLNYDDPDVDNMVRIDVACSRRDVDYVLAVLQSDDMLYVSRAIKRSTWLITDDQYAHIINPQHLHDELFPKMTAKAQNKLILAIRLNLKNKSRVDEFYNYYSDDMNVAQKWLQHCSSSVVEKVISERVSDLRQNTFKRQCENSIDALKALMKNKDVYYIGDKLAASKVLLHKYPEEYLDLLLQLNNYSTPNFGIHATKQIMQKCPDKLINNFRKFRRNVHLPTFAKYLKKEDIQRFLIQQAEDKKMKDWVKYENIKHFVKYLPVATRFQFVKKLFIDKEVSSASEAAPVGFACERVMLCDGMAMKSRSGRFGPSTSNAHIYRWYQLAPFETAMTELKKLIRVESSPLERNTILTVLINCARRNPQHVQSLLKFYREKHMNEPFKFKIQFVNTLLSLVDTHKFDSSTWNILNEIFTSMEVFTESENCVPQCVKAIIVYKLLHDEDIPEIITKKFLFESFTDYRKKLNEKEADTLIKYLYNLEMNKLNKQTINNDAEMDTAFSSLSNILYLLKDWKKKISDYPEVLDKIKFFIKSKNDTNNLKTSLTTIYDVEKKWRKQLFEESLVLAPNDRALVRALKHDPGLLLRWSTEVAEIRSNDAISLKHTLTKLRIYWAQTLAENWTEAYLAALDKPTGHKATTEGICILLPKKRFHSLLQKYVPAETKIDWSNTDTTLLSLQKNIVKRIKLVRPCMNLDAVLAFAKDDYLQFALPSLMALMYNMSAAQVLEYIPVLFNSPVSLKKHGLRLAYTKLKFSEIKDLVGNMWQQTKNSSIKTVLLKETFDLLKKEKKESSIKDLWVLMNMFIEYLTPDENRVIYNTLAKAEDVPLSVRPQFFMKSYTYLKSLPAKANCESILNSLDRHAPQIIELLEPSFVDDVLLPPVVELVKLTTKIDNQSCSDIHLKIEIIGAYIICNKDPEAAFMKYEKYVVPVLNGCFESWKVVKNGRYDVKEKCLLVLRTLVCKIKPWILKNQSLHPAYKNIFEDIGKRLRSSLPVEENYKFLTYWSLTESYVGQFCDNLKFPIPSADAEATISLKRPAGYVRAENDDKWQEVCTGVAPLFGKAFLEYYVKQDIKSSQRNLLSSIFVKAMTDVFDQLDVQFIPRVQILKHMLDVTVPESYLMALEATNSLYCMRDEKQLKLRRELFDIIKSHPSIDVKIHYNDILNNDPEIEEAIPYDNSGMLRA